MIVRWTAQYREDVFSHSCVSLSGSVFECVCVCEESIITFFLFIIISRTLQTLGVIVCFEKKTKKKQGHLRHTLHHFLWCQAYCSHLGPASRLRDGVCNDHGLSFSLPSLRCQRKAGDDPSPLTQREMEIITNVSCGIGHKLIHTKYCTLGVSLSFFLSLFLVRCTRQMNASRRN